MSLYLALDKLDQININIVKLVLWLPLILVQHSLVLVKRPTIGESSDVPASGYFRIMQNFAITNIP